MRLSMPDVARQVPLEQPAVAIQEYAAIIRELRGGVGGAGDLEALATEAVETAHGSGAILLAVLTPPDAAPALLTGIALDVPPSWDVDTADALRDALANVGGPDVRETRTLETELGPAVIALRFPSVEQARARRPLTLQLQAFVPQPGTGRMLLLTLASPALDGWQTHRFLFGQIVASAAPDDPSELESRWPAVLQEESFEHHTYQL
jgi:hypothetical protein